MAFGEIGGSRRFVWSLVSVGIEQFGQIALAGLASVARAGRRTGRDRRHSAVNFSTESWRPLAAALLDRAVEHDQARAAGVCASTPLSAR